MEKWLLLIIGNGWAFMLCGKLIYDLMTTPKPQPPPRYTIEEERVFYFDNENPNTK
jgi:hypothetical protein